MPRVQTKQKEPSQAQLAARAAGAERLRAANQVRSVRPVRSPRRFVDTTDHDITPVDEPRKMKSSGPARESLEPRLVEPVDGPVDPEKLANLAFMQEMVTVLIHPSENPDAVQFPEVWNDSRKEIFQRNVPKRVRRMFVEVLARMKITKYRQEIVVDKEGTKAYQYIPYSALTYPFVIEEDTPKGRDWLRKILSEV